MNFFKKKINGNIITESVKTIVFVGIKPYEVLIEVQISSGLPSFIIVGLPDKSIMESRERVRGALASIGIEFPAKKIIVNLSPASITKGGSRYDLPIAVCLMKALGFLKDKDFKNCFFLGELGLDGSVYGITGIIPAAIFNNEKNTVLIFPMKNIQEIVAIQNYQGGRGVFLPLAHIKDIFSINLNNKEKFLEQAEQYKVFQKETEKEEKYPLVYGQELAKRALTIALAGKHNLMIFGPPGSGKSLLAHAVPTLLPPLSKKEVLEVSSIHSIAGTLGNSPLLTLPPFRAPHGSISLPALVGGGSNCMPGEISLAHGGVLFIDEFTEMNTQHVDSLRQPIEQGEINLSRVKYNVNYPAGFLLIVTLNPCKCGFYSSAYRACQCSNKHIIQYQKKISGPIKQRFSLAVHMDIQESFLDSIGDPHTWIRNSREQIAYTRDYFSREGKKIPEKILESLDVNVMNLLKKIAKKNTLSSREIFSLINVAYTISILDKKEYIDEKIILEAFSYTILLKENLLKENNI